MKLVDLRSMDCVNVNVNVLVVILCHSYLNTFLVGKRRSKGYTRSPLVFLRLMVTLESFLDES